jgi:uncharacterized protein (TIGR03435 family)
MWIIACAVLFAVGRGTSTSEATIPICNSVCDITMPLGFDLTRPMQRFGRRSVAALAQTGLPPMPPPPPPLQTEESPQAGKAPAKVPEFAVTSVKASKPEARMFRLMTPPNGFSTTNVPLKTLIEFAWDVNAERISGAPSWIEHTNYDIEAKVDDADISMMRDLTPLQRREMVRKLLENRFALKVHEETKELPVYALVVAKGGPKLHDAKPGDTYANGFQGPDGKSGTGAMMFSGKQLVAQGLPISSLTPTLTQQTGRTVIDKTGLTGKYDFTLDLPGGQRPMPMAKPPDGSEAGANSTSDDSGPSIFTLVQDELGLKLESTKAPLPILVIDHVEQPSVN